MTWRAVVAVGCMIAGVPAVAIERAPAPPSSDDSIVVNGVRRNPESERREASAFIRRVSALPVGGQFARWNDPLCLSVAGLDEPVARRVIARVSAMATEAGAATAKAGCSPNVMIVFTPNGSAWLSTMLNRVPGLLRESSLDEKRLIKADGAPIRWWYRTKVENADGSALAHESPALISVPGGVVSNGGALSSDSYSSSMINSQIRASIASAVVVVDVSRMTGAKLDSVISYVGFVLLSRARMDATYDGRDSILGCCRSATNWPARRAGCPTGTAPI